MARTLRTLAALTAGALGAAAVARSTRRTPPDAVTDPPAPPAPPPPASRVVPPPPVRERRPAWVWVAYVLGWPLGLGVFLVFAGGFTIAAVWGPDTVRYVEWVFWGSIATTPVGGYLLWVAARDDEEREGRYAWAVATWQARHGRGVGGGDGTTSSGYGSSGYVADPTYGAAWGGGYDGGGSYDGGGYSGGSDGGGGGGFSSSY